MEVKEFKEFGFVVKAIKNTHWVDFEILKIYGIDENEVILYHNDELVYTTNIEDSEVFANGSVKWDGCSNWNIGEDGVMVHSCNKEGLLNIGNILSACWDWASVLIPNVWLP